MNIWLINPYGQIPGEGWRDYRFTLAARALAVRGHRVTWWTARFDHHTKRMRAAVPAETFAIELVDTPPYSGNISVARLRFELAFARNVLHDTAERPRPDIVIAADPPQFCGAAGRGLAKRHGARLVIDCLDLWPELFVRSAPSLLRPLVSIAVQPLRAMRRRTAQSSALAIAAADAYHRVLADAGARRVVTIPIGVDVDALKVMKIDHDRFTLVYAGSLGERYDLDTVVDAVAGLDVELLIAGRGPVEGRLLARRAGNVRLLGVVPPSELPRLYAKCDAGIASYAAGSTVALPLKLFDYLAAGLPIITSLGGEAGALAAARYQAGDVQSLRQAIAAVQEMRHEPPSASAFDTRLLYERYADEIEAVAR